jgi:hypothetical protein
LLSPKPFPRALLAHSRFSFTEAEMAQNRILELKEQEFNMQYQQLVFQHQQRQEEIQHAHIEQYQEFNKHWDSVLAKAQEEDQ